MIRIILMIGIVVCCVLIGNMIKNCLFVRCQIFKDFKGLCKSISNEITFLKTDKFTMLNNREFLDKRSAEIIHNYLLLGKVDCAYLKNAENKALNDFLNSIGKMDVDGEINNLNYYENLIDEYCVATEENYLKYGVFSIKISIIIGALIVIFLI